MLCSPSGQGLLLWKQDDLHSVFDWSLMMDWCLQVKAALLEKSKGIDRAEHVRKQREIKRFGKKVRLCCVCCWCVEVLGN